MIIMAAIIFAGLFMWVAVEALSAPLGYEDETGFHYGEPKHE